MSIEVKVPALPESVADATISAWHKQVGDIVSRDENLVDLETDKVVLEVPAPIDGIIKAIVQAEGSTVTPNQILAVLDEASGNAANASSDSHSDKRVGQQPSDGDAQASLSPAVRKLISEHNLKPENIQGSGKNGRILKEDVVHHIESRSKTATDIASSEASAHTPPVPQSAPLTTASADRPEKRVAMTRLRARIAERLLQAQANAAILTTFNEVNMRPVMELRAQHKEAFEKRHDVKLGFMSFFVKAVIEALKRFPAVNASIDGSDIVYHGYYDIGVAVSSPRGLVVPIVRNADRLGMADIEKTIAILGQKAKEGTLDIQDMTGGTFTISNGGVFGSLMSTPILNPPQSAILGMHKIMERPVVENGEIIARPMMYLALSYDHRIIDGRESVQFLVTIKELLEDPARILLEV